MNNLIFILVLYHSFMINSSTSNFIQINILNFFLCSTKLPLPDFVLLDMPRFGQYNIQDSATKIHYLMTLFHIELIFYLILISILIIWFLIRIHIKFIKKTKLFDLSKFKYISLKPNLKKQTVLNTKLNRKFSNIWKKNWSINIKILY